MTVVEDRREHVAPAAQVDVADLALGLEDRPHDVRERVVDADDLLELVEDEHDAPPALRRDLRRELEQPLDRRVDVRRPADRLEREPDAAVAGVELDRRPHAEAADDRARPLEQALDGREEVVDDRLRETRSEPHLRRRPHQVAVRDEHLVGEHLLHRAEDERRLPVAAGREHDDVLPVAHVRRQRRDLRVPVRERVVLRERAERERVGRVTHDCIMHICVTQWSVSAVLYKLHLWIRASWPRSARWSSAARSRRRRSCSASRSRRSRSRFAPSRSGSEPSSSTARAVGSSRPSPASGSTAAPRSCSRSRSSSSTTSSPRRRATSRARSRSARRPGPRRSWCRSSSASSSALHPAVRVALEVHDTRTVVELVADRRLELGIVGATPRHRAVRFEPFAEDEVVLVCPPAHRFAGADDRRRRALVRDPDRDAGGRGRAPGRGGRAPPPRRSAPRPRRPARARAAGVGAQRRARGLRRDVHLADRGRGGARGRDARGGACRGHGRAAGDLDRDRDGQGAAPRRAGVRDLRARARRLRRRRPGPRSSPRERAGPDARLPLRRRGVRGARGGLRRGRHRPPDAGHERPRRGARGCARVRRRVRRRRLARPGRDRGGGDGARAGRRGRRARRPRWRQRDRHLQGGRHGARGGRGRSRCRGSSPCRRRTPAPSGRRSSGCSSSPVARAAARTSAPRPWRRSTTPS